MDKLADAYQPCGLFLRLPVRQFPRGGLCILIAHLSTLFRFLF